MTYNFNGEQITPEEWRWIAVYDDGSELHQYDDETKDFHQFKEIDQSKLHVFKMTDGNRLVSLIFDAKEMKLIHFYKRYVLNVGTEEESKVTLYVFGYETGDSKVLNVITPTGEVVTTNDLTNLRVTG